MSEAEYILKELSKTIDLNKYSRLYVIVWYDLSGFCGITSRVATTLEEILEIYSKEYAPKDEYRISEYYYRIAEIKDSQFRFL